MNDRLPGFVIALIVGLAAVGFGLFGHQQRVYQMPAPEDDPSDVRIESSEMISEVRLTDWIAKERVIRDDWGNLIDRAIEAPCYS